MLRYVGLDVGSISVDAVVMTDDGEIIEARYVRHLGRPLDAALGELEAVLARCGPVDGLCLTGSGARTIADVLGVPFVNEVVAQGRAAALLAPGARTVIEIGGTESKLIVLGHGADGKTRVEDFAMNSLCAAGTGSFLDQQASRMKVGIEEFSRLALKSENPPRVAGRCSVFAKSDMIHLQQLGTPDYDIIAGLCHAMAHNFKGTVGLGKAFERPIAFQGGVALNDGMVRAFTDVLGLAEGELIIPPHCSCTGAIGAVLQTLDEGRDCSFDGLEPLRRHLNEPLPETARLAALEGNGYTLDVDAHPLPHSDGPVDVYIGVDIGSISTNVVALDADHNVVARRYLMTEGRPIEAVRKGLYEVGQDLGDRVTVRGCATTGSGRYLIGELIGADLIKNEITTHARAAVAADPRVETVFEIGGQDAKYMSLQDGAVVDFTMNKVCAAGTGSFLEEQAERLGLKIEEEFGREALSSRAPCKLGERCTVFMESDLTYHQQRGVRRKDLVGGLCYSIVANYLNRVVEDRKVGEVVFFQGGVAFNRGVKAAFEAVLGREVLVPPHHDIMGAIGAAMLAHEHAGDSSAFRGFDLRNLKYELKTFECNGCSNRCEIHRVAIEGQKPLHYGSRCGKFDDEHKHDGGRGLPKLFDEREDALLNTYPTDEPRDPIGLRIGIPRALTFFEFYPFWKAFFTEIGCRVVLSDPTNKGIVRQGCEAMQTEACLPISLAHGHVLDLVDADVDYVFVPSVVDLEHEAEEAVGSYACPLAQSLPYLLRAALPLPADGPQLLAPVLHFEWGRPAVDAELQRLGRTLGVRAGRVQDALVAAWKAQAEFRRRLVERGTEVLDALGEDEHAVVIVSRPYNGCDAGANLGVPDKLRDMGVTAIPLDMLPLDLPALGREFPHMYWKYGQRILAGARFIAERPNLHAVYVTNFRCGPDSFVSKFFDRVLGQPYLTLEIDEHSADVGALTRCEAFIDSFRSAGRHAGGRPLRRVPAGSGAGAAAAGGRRAMRKIFIPHMDDHNVLMAAALRANGLDAEPLPMSDDQSLELGRRFTTGKECYPCILTTGDMVKRTRRDDFDPDGTAFFMPQACGPCRFGQYHHFQRMVLDELGLDGVPMIVLDQGNDFLKDIKGFGAGFYRSCWQLALILDFMQKTVRGVRPYEVNPGETDRIYEEGLRELAEVAERRGDHMATAAEISRRLRAVPTDRSQPRPIVGIVGEIYVRSHEFANAFLVRKLERLGARVLLPPFQEWLSYIACERREIYLRKGALWRLAREGLAEWVCRRDERRVAALFDGAAGPMARETSMRKVLQLGSRYVHPSVKGEAILSMARAVEYVEHGVHGIVNVAPFGCMPGAVVNGLLEEFRRDHDAVPVLRLAFDGVDQPGEDMLLDAFVHQARQRMNGGP